MSRSTRFAAVLATMHAAHNLGDHVVQTDNMALRKADRWPVMLSHVGSYHAVMAGMLLAADQLLGLGLSRRRLAAALAVSAGTHAFLDRRWPVRRILEATGSLGFARLQTPLNGPYLADQALHHACLWLAALVAVSEPEGTGKPPHS